VEEVSRHPKLCYQKGGMAMNYGKLRRIYAQVSLAYSANLNSNGEPENEEVSGNLGNAMEMIDQLIEEVTK
jgi:hypothetical protein